MFTYDVVCQGIPTNFSNISITNNHPIESWFWDFGDQQYSNEKKPVSHGYLQSGDYDVTLYVNSENGCSDSINSVVQVGSLPEKSISISGPLSFCSGDSSLLSSTYFDDFKYQWLLDGEPITGANESSFHARISGSYSVHIENTIGNCTNESNDINIEVREAPFPPEILVSGEYNPCLKDSIELKVRYDDDMHYIWRLNEGIVGRDTNIFVTKTNGIYSVEVYNDFECRVSSSNEKLLSFAPSIPLLSEDGVLKVCSGKSPTIFLINYDPQNLYTWILDDSQIDNESNEITISESGIYWVNCRDQNNCISNSEEVTIQYIDSLQKPNIEFLEGDTLVCPNEHVMLNVSNYDSTLQYYWTNGITNLSENSEVFQVFEEGYFQASVTAFGCSEVSNQIMVKYKNALPKPDIIASGPNVWYLALSNDSASGYRWYFENQLVDEGNNNIYFANQQYGKYFAEITDDYNCYTQSNVIRIPENNIVGVAKSDPWKGLQIYPNPTPGVFNIEMDNPIMGDLIIDIFGETGAKVINIKFHKTTTHFLTQIDLSEQPAAVYLIGLMLEEWRTTRRLVVE
ncbi:PKD domain-containing protein [Bacteroidota bacterium]